MALVGRPEFSVLLLRNKFPEARINCLPAEILIAILQLCLPDKLKPCFVSKTLLLCHVCRFWRTCLLDLPSIWCTLSFNFDKLESKSKYKPGPTLKFWLAHTKKHPLSLSIKATYQFQMNTKDIFDDIAPVANRLQELNVNVGSIDHIPFFFWKGGMVSSLERLSLQVADRIGDDESDDENKSSLTPITVFDGAPALRVATFGFASERLSDKSYFPFPWHQLTHLNIVRFILPRTFHEILAQCTNLEEALFTIGSWEDEEDIPCHPIITLEHLSALKLKLEETFKDESLFRDYNFPNIHLFDLCVQGTHSPVVFTDVPAGISSGSLKSLRLSGEDLQIDISAISRYLCGCSSLESLVLYLPEITPRDIFSALATAAHFLLKLRTLILFISLEWEPELTDDETISACENLLAAWTQHTTTGKTMQLLTMYQLTAFHTFSHCGHWRMKLGYQRHDKIAETIDKKLHGSLKTGLYDEAACPTGTNLFVKYVGPRKHLPSEEDDGEE